MFINKIYSCLDSKKGHFFLNAAACKAQSTGKLNFSHKACNIIYKERKRFAGSCSKGAILCLASKVTEQSKLQMLHINRDITGKKGSTLTSHFHGSFSVMDHQGVVGIFHSTPLLVISSICMMCKSDKLEPPTLPWSASKSFRGISAPWSPHLFNKSSMVWLELEYINNRSTL